jgi:hypothetical protein
MDRLWEIMVSLSNDDVIFCLLRRQAVKAAFDLFAERYNLQMIRDRPGMSV